MRRAASFGALLLTVGAAVWPAAAAGSWQSAGPGGTAAAKAMTMPAGATPTATVSGRNVTVSWTAATLPSGAVVGDYSVQRYGATSGQAQTVGASCSGTVQATTCTESAVPAGDWKYSVTPRQGNWAGTESTRSATATVAAPTLSFSSSTTVTTLPTTLSGSLANFAGGATVTFRLDDPNTGTVLTASTSPSPLPANGSATVSVTIPSGTANGSHTVYAVGSAGSVASAAITVAVVTCPTSAPSLSWLSGLESAFSTTAGGGMWNVAAGTAAVDSTVKRNGAYSLKLAPAAGAAYRGRIYTVVSSAYVVRFAVRLASLPSADSELAGFLDLNHSTPPYFSVKYVAATQKLAIGYPGQTVSSSSTVQAGTWYSIEVRFDPRANPQTANWRVDGVAQTSTSYSATGAGAYEIYFGSATAATYTANYDDIAISETPADYPLGDGKVLALLPNGMGTSVGAANFVNDDGTAIGSSSWNRLDDVPMGTSTDYVKQATGSTTSYVEVTFDDTTETCVRAVGGRVVWDPQNTNQSNDGKTTIVDGTTERTLHAGSMTANNALMNPKYATIAPVAGAWTPTTVNALKGRIGYSGDASPAPMWHALMLEYDVPQ